MASPTTRKPFAAVFRRISTTSVTDGHVRNSSLTDHDRLPHRPGVMSQPANRVSELRHGAMRGTAIMVLTLPVTGIGYKKLRSDWQLEMT